MKWSLMVLFFALAACSSDDEATVSDEIVINGLVHAGQQVRDIQVFRLAEIGSENIIIPDDQLTVGAFREDQPFLLIEQEAKPGHYFEPFAQLIPSPGDVIIVAAIYRSDTILAFTQVPSFPVGLSWPADVIPLGPEALDSGVEIPVAWLNSDTSFYVAKVEILNDDPEPIDPDRFSEEQKVIVLPITLENQYMINIGEFGFYGDYRFVLFHVTEHYADFFQANPGGSQFQQGAPDNLVNTLGFFSALSSDTAFFSLVPN